MTDATVTRLPLSHSQQLLAALDYLHSGGASGPKFVITMGCRITGTVDEARLREAVDDVVARHDGLRAVVVPEEGRAASQLVSPPLPGRFTVVDLTTPDRAAPDSAAEADRAARDRRAEEFLDELDAGSYPADVPPLLWVFLGRLADDDAVLALVAHHSVTDSWSMDVLMRDLAGCYQARLEGRAPQLPPAGDYAAYVSEDRAAATSDRAARAAEYWQRHLDGLPLPTVPADGPRVKGRSPVKTKQRFTLSPQRYAALAAVSRQARCTPFITLLTGYAVLLRRMTGDDDLHVTTLSSGRGRPELDNLVGYLLNPVPLRIDLSGDPTLAECLARVRRTCLDAYRYELPIQRLLQAVPAAVSAIADKRALTVPFQYLPTRQRTAPQPFGAGGTRQGIQRSAAHQERGVAMPLDALWTLQPTDAGGLSGNFSYTPGVFTDETGAGMVAGFLDVLERLVSEPERRVGQLPAAP